uniref:non-specific serine/threonine protein kinase n=1 Tax=Globodera pallida TaxID=36090 RepID=A0A183CHP4_GLOPA
MVNSSQQVVGNGMSFETIDSRPAMTETAENGANATTNDSVSINNTSFNNASSGVIQRCFPQNELQGRRIRLYRNGDRFFKGIWYTVIPSLRSWSAFLEDLQKIHFFIGSISLPQGVRFIFHVSGEQCNTLEEIQHGQSYVVSSADKFKRIDYANAAQPMWSFVSNKLSEPPKYGLRETFTREPNDFVHPRIITIIRNGIKPRRVVRHLLNKRTAQSFDMVISDITAIIKLNSGVVRKLYSLNGKQMSTLADFFRDDYIFIAYGTERISLDDFFVISEEYKRMEINKNKPPRLNGQFKLRPTQLKMLNKRSDGKEFRKKVCGTLNGDVELPLELKEQVKILEVLGDGNTALVYKAAFRGDKDGEEQWAMDALKIVREETLRNDEVLAFVRTEVDLLGTLSHEHIVRLMNCQILDGSWFIRMELVQDGDLFELLRKKRTLSETETASCAECLCQALDYLHSEHWIVHRDVKLENLLVYSRDDRIMIKLADFGLAYRLQQSDQLLYQLCGTPTYVAPEVLAEFGYSFKADCWSIGIIVFILLCGFPPFGVDEPDEVLFNRILRGQFDFPSPSFDSISFSVKLLVARLLNTDPNSRFSASNVLDSQWIKTMGDKDGEEQWAMDALKIVREETLRNDEVLAFVRTEVDLLGTLSHEHIVRLMNCQILDGSWFIRMELVQDGDLFELLRKKRTLSETETASCAECLCQALDYLHSEHWIVHRDVKLENLLVYSRDDRIMIKLADFGLAYRLQQSDQLLFVNLF